jgi:hypothetical protein
MSFRSPGIFPFVFYELNGARDCASVHANIGKDVEIERKT